MITMNVHGTCALRADAHFGINASWITLRFEGTRDPIELTMFVADFAVAKNYADAINAVPFKAPIDEQVAA